MLVVGGFHECTEFLVTAVLLPPHPMAPWRRAVVLQLYVIPRFKSRLDYFESSQGRKEDDSALGDTNYRQRVGAFNIYNREKWAVALIIGVGFLSQGKFCSKTAGKSGQTLWRHRAHGKLRRTKQQRASTSYFPWLGFQFIE